MEFIYAGAALLTALLCAFFYRMGYAKGLGTALNNPRRSPVLLKTDGDTGKDNEDERAYEKSLQEQFQALIDYQPEFTAMRK